MQGHTRPTHRFRTMGSLAVSKPRPNLKPIEQALVDLLEENGGYLCETATALAEKLGCSRRYLFTISRSLMGKKIVNYTRGPSRPGLQLPSHWRLFPPASMLSTTREREFPPASMLSTTREREFPPAYISSKDLVVKQVGTSALSISSSSRAAGGNKEPQRFQTINDIPDESADEKLLAQVLDCYPKSEIAASVVEQKANGNNPWMLDGQRRGLVAQVKYAKGAAPVSDDVQEKRHQMLREVMIDCYGILPSAVAVEKITFVGAWEDRELLASVVEENHGSFLDAGRLRPLAEFDNDECRAAAAELDGNREVHIRSCWTAWNALSDRT